MSKRSNSSSIFNFNSFYFYFFSIAVFTTVFVSQLLLLQQEGFFVSAACQGYTRLEFHANQETEGLRSYITQANQAVPYTLSVPFATDIVVNVISPEVLDRVTDIGGTQLDTRMDGKSITITASPALRLAGGVADVIKGRAIFNAFTVHESPVVPTILIFSLPLGNGTVLKLETGQVTPVTNSPNPVSARFANFGFLRREGQPLFLPIARTDNSLSPLLRIEVLQANGKQILSSAFTVQIQCSIGVANPPVWQFSVGQFIDLTLNHEGGSPGDKPVCQFNVSSAAWSGVLNTGPITLVSTAQRNRFMFFDFSNSFVPYDNGGQICALDVPLPPMIINLYNSAFERDTSNTGLVITAHSLQGQLTGGEAVVVNGVATFDRLAFTGTPIDYSVITFVAGSQGGLPVGGTNLYSGPMRVAITTVKKSSLAFSPLSAIQGGIIKTIKLSGRDFLIPPIVVVVKDSAGQFDSTANDIRLSLRLEPAQAAIEDPSRTVVNGLAAWGEFTIPANSKISFSIVISDESGAVSESLRSGQIIVEPDRYTTPAEASALFFLCTNPPPPPPAINPCIFSLRFADKYTTFSSLIYKENQDIFTTIGGRIPSIRVQLLDVFGVTSDRGALDAKTVPAIFCMTGIDPRNEELLVRGGSRDQDTGTRTQGIFKNGVYEFSCLEFGAIPTGLIRLKFAAYNVSKEGKILNRLEAISIIQSGFVTVTATTVNNYDLRFDQSNSLIVYEGQIVSGAANIALPPITVQVVNSNNELDYTGDGFVISARPTSGAIDAGGAREVVTKGKATFSNIKFTVMGNEPKLAFTAFQTNSPVRGKSVSSGVFILAALPIEFFEIAFAPTKSDFSDVTHEFQDMTFATFSDAVFKVSIYVRDSAHQVHASNGGNQLAIESLSSEAQVENAAGSTIVSFDPLCNCANFTTKVTRRLNTYPAGTKIYVRYKVQTGPALLQGKELVVGPILIESDLRGSTTCETSIITPVILGEFRLTQAAFEGQRDTIKTAIAKKMGLESSRVTILKKTDSIVRRDFDSGGEWAGTLGKVIFSNPFPNSTNLRTSSELANDFVKLRALCEEVQLSMQSVYFEEEVKTCDLNAFRASLDKAKSCANDLLIPLCQCYDEGPAAIWGFPCQEDPLAQSMLVEMCTATVDCPEASVTAVCSGLVSALATNLAWLWALLGCTIGLIMLALVLKKKGVTIGKGKVKLNFFDKLGHKRDIYEIAD